MTVMSNSWKTTELIRTVLILGVVFLAVLTGVLLFIAAAITVLAYLVLWDHKKIRRLEAQLAQNAPKVSAATGTGPAQTVQSSESSSATEA